MAKQLIKRWQTRRGKHWYELYEDETGFSYKCDGGGGSLGDLTRSQAIGLLIRKMMTAYNIDGIRYEEVPIEAVRNT